MRIDSVKLQNNSTLINDYKDHEPKIMKYFDYSPMVDDYDKRVADLQDRSFKRKQLSSVLQKIFSS